MCCTMAELEPTILVAMHSHVLKSRSLARDIKPSQGLTGDVHVENHVPTHIYSARLFSLFTQMYRTCAGAYRKA